MKDTSPGTYLWYRPCIYRIPSRRVQKREGKTEESAYKGEPEDGEEGSLRQPPNPSYIGEYGCKTKFRNLFRRNEPHQLWKTYITDITTDLGMTNQMCIWVGFVSIKDGKDTVFPGLEWQRIHKIGGEYCSNDNQWLIMDHLLKPRYWG